MMLEHLTAVGARLVALNAAYKAFVGSAPPNTLPPYWIVSAPGWDVGDDAPLAPDASLDTDVRVKAVAGQVAGVFPMLDLARANLSPGLVDSALAVSGRHARIGWERSEFVDVDPDLTLPNTNTNLGVGVETYHLTSNPA